MAHSKMCGRNCFLPHILLLPELGTELPAGLSMHVRSATAGPAQCDLLRLIGAARTCDSRRCILQPSIFVWLDVKYTVLEQADRESSSYENTGA